MIRIGDLLVSKGIITEDQLKQALEIQRKEPLESKRQIGKILYEDLNVPQHAIMHELSALFAIHELKVDVESISEEKIDFIKQIFDNRTDDLRLAMIKVKMIPFDLKGKDQQEILTIIAADPTNPSVAKLAEQLPYTNFEIAYTQLEVIDALLNKILSSQNELLNLLEEIDYDESNIVEDEVVDEAALDAEINQSALTNLVEGVLVEAVRQDVSDIHIIPQPGNVTDINFRVDGKLEIWHSQKGVKPEAISAVFKDKTRNVDRFERESAQDGFIQRKVDDYLIRYRVSIVPVVGAEFDRKLESIVLRILDDRKVISDLKKLGLQQQALEGQPTHQLLFLPGAHDGGWDREEVARLDARHRLGRPSVESVHLDPGRTSIQ